MSLVPIRERILEGKIIETDAQKLPKWVLARVVYPICNCKPGELNRNGRYYGPEVWEKVNKDAEILEKLTNRTMFGMIEHPATTQSKLDGPISHVVTKLWYDANEGKQYAEIDILDTPHGVTFFKLLESGSKVGVSTRAEGEMREAEEGGKKFMRVVAESFKFETLDSTADPSTYGAIPKDVQLSIVNHIATSVKNEQFDKQQALAVLKEFKEPEAVALLESIQKVVETQVSVDSEGKVIVDSPDSTVTVDKGNTEVVTHPVEEPVVELPAEVSDELPVASNVEGELTPTEEPDPEPDAPADEDAEKELGESDKTINILRTEIKELKVKLGEAVAERQSAVSLFEEKESQFGALAQSMAQESQDLQKQRDVVAKLSEQVAQEGARADASDKKVAVMERSIAAMLKSNGDLNEKAKKLEVDLKNSQGLFEAQMKDLKEAHAKELLKTYAHAVVEATGFKISAKALTLLEQCTSRDEVLKTLGEMRLANGEALLHSGGVKPSEPKPVVKTPLSERRDHGIMRSLVTGRI